MKWLYLVFAIMAEIIATTSLKYSNSFTKLIPSIIVVIGYCTAFYFMSLTMKYLPVSLVYAFWSGIGIFFIFLIDIFIFRQKMDLAAVLGVLLIIAGVLVINLFSKSISH